MKTSKPRILFATFAIAWLSASASAREITVPSGAILTIQQAVDLAAPGDTVLVRPGTYSNPEVGQYWPPVVFIGQEKPGLKLRAMGAPGSVKIVGPGLGRGVIATADNLLLEGFDIAGFDTGISAGGARGARITGNRIRECPSGAITLSGADGWEIDHNRIEGGQNGIFLNGWPGAGPNQGHHIHHNLVTGARLGIFLWQSPACTIDQNETSNNHELGIYLASSPNCMVDHNLVRNNASIGILVGNSPNAMVSNNQASDNSVWGIAVWASCGSRFERNTALGNGDSDLFAPNWETNASCNSNSQNRAATAVPSLEVWDARSPRTAK